MLQNLKLANNLEERKQSRVIPPREDPKKRIVIEIQKVEYDHKLPKNKQLHHLSC